MWLLAECSKTSSFSPCFYCIMIILSSRSHMHIAPVFAELGSAGCVDTAQHHPNMFLMGEGDDPRRALALWSSPAGVSLQAVHRPLIYTRFINSLHKSAQTATAWTWSWRELRSPSRGDGESYLTEWSPSVALNIPLNHYLTSVKQKT